MRVAQKMEELKEEFKKSLQEMTRLADELGCYGFAQMFAKGYSTLNQEDMPIKKRLSKAYDETRNFGGMGAWNDSPPCIAQEKGILERFDSLTDNFWNIRQKIKKKLGKILN